MKRFDFSSFFITDGSLLYIFTEMTWGLDECIFNRELGKFSLFLCLSMYFKVTGRYKIFPLPSVTTVKNVRITA